jgi:hypothetical protein
MADTLPPTMTIPRFTKGKVLTYQRYKDIKEETSRLNARLKDLEKEKRELCEELCKVYEEKGTSALRLGPRLILTRTVVSQPEAVITRKAYSYSILTETQG